MNVKCARLEPCPNFETYPTVFSQLPPRRKKEYNGSLKRMMLYIDYFWVMGAPVTCPRHLYPDIEKTTYPAVDKLRMQKNA